MKKIKINWGQGLTIGMGIFMAFIIVMGVFMFTQSSDEYDDHYYEKGLAYDSVYNKERLVIVEKVQPHIQVQPGNLHLVFAAPAKGSIHFERWADPSLDKDISFNVEGANAIDIPLTGFKTGRWDLSLEWKNDGKKYLYQQQIRVR